MSLPLRSGRTIEKQEPKERERLTYLRNAFASLMVTGPFSILVGYTGGLMALNDRLEAAQHGCRRKGRHRIHRLRGMRDSRHPA